MRRLITLFVSYARANQALVDRFIESLSEQMKPSRTYEYRLWCSMDLLAGTDWNREIRKELKASHSALLLISPAFLCSNYIKRVELPCLLHNEHRPVFPILLQPVDFERHDLLGLERIQIFQLKTANVKCRGAYMECNKDDKRRFIEALFRQIEQRLDEYVRTNKIQRSFPGR